MIMQFLFLAILSAGAAQPDFEPKNFCHRDCTEAQQRIWQEFENASFYPEVSQPKLYSGECFHLYGPHNKEQTHHGAFYVKAVNGQTHAGGAFSFFFTKDPYEGLSPVDAETKFSSVEREQNKLQFLNTSALLDFSDKETPWRYWMRHSADSQKLLVVGQWGLFQLLFCEMRSQW